MLKNKAYKFRAYPNREQQILLARTFGCVRLVYNHFLAERIQAYKDEKRAKGYVSCANDLTAMKKSDEYIFLKEVDSIALQQSLRHLDMAYKNFFKRPEVGFPKFKSKKNHKQSYTTICINGNIALLDGYIKLPKIGMLKIKQHREVPVGYTLKSVTVSKSCSGKYHVSCLLEYDIEIEPVKANKIIGLDYSSPELYIDSNGNEPEYPKFYRRAEERLKREQRKLSLMVKGSKNREKQRRKVARISEHVANQRKDFLHKLSTQIANEYDVVAIENLNMKAMAQSLNLGKSTHDNGWGMFTKLLGYKLDDRGKALIKVGKWFASTKTCSCCGSVKPMKLSERTYVCPECGVVMDRDTNAAINIRNEAIRMLG